MIELTYLALTCYLLAAFILGFAAACLWRHRIEVRSNIAHYEAGCQMGARQTLNEIRNAHLAANTVRQLNRPNLN